jgi:hypothetical protein
MNRIHARFEIANEDYLYVLSTLVFEPIRWNERFGWRPLLDVERLATFNFWREVGRRMAIQDIPGSYDAFEQFNRDFEREHFAYTEAGHRVAEATRDMFLGWFPGLPKQLGRPALHALLDDRLLDVLGLQRSTPALRNAIERVLRARAVALRLCPARRKPRLRTEERSRSYRDGWDVEALGPPPADAAPGII